MQAHNADESAAQLHQLLNYLSQKVPVKDQKEMDLYSPLPVDSAALFQAIRGRYDPSRPSEFYCQFDINTDHEKAIFLMDSEYNYGVLGASLGYIAIHADNPDQIGLFFKLLQGTGELPDYLVEPCAAILEAMKTASGDDMEVGDSRVESRFGQLLDSLSSGSPVKEGTLGITLRVSFDIAALFPCVSFSYYSDHPVLCCQAKVNEAHERARGLLESKYAEERFPGCLPAVSITSNKPEELAAFFELLMSTGEMPDSIAERFDAILKAARKAPPAAGAGAHLFFERADRATPQPGEDSSDMENDG